MRRMGWVKLAGIAVGILIAFLVVGSVIGFIIHAVTYLVLAALVVGGIAVAIKVASSRRQVSGKKAEREVREQDYSQYNRPLPRADVEPAAPPPSPVRPATHDVDDELARLKREMGSLALPVRLYQFAPASLVTAVRMPSMRTRAAVRRPITHMVSSAGLPTTVTAGVAFRAVIR
jgi:hypothetical protein